MNYKVALYIRLSREDEDKDNQSESIINQKSLLLQYVKENNLEVYDTYIDDGYSGTNFDRPSFNRLIKDIEDKKINMVITKDMSRLGRDYIGTGNLVEKYFPQNNIRYIAVTDNIDTYLDSTNNDIAPFKAIMNDMYAKDISKKIRTSLRAKMKEGKFVGARPPYGYKKDNKDKNKLVIDEEKSIIVKRIFDLSLKGFNSSKIAKILTEDNIKSPSEYYDYWWQNNNVNVRKWSAKTVKDILTNRIYTGDMVQNKRNKVNYKVNKIINNNIEDYIVIENVHASIIDKEIFNKVQKILPKNKYRIEKKENYLLDGLLYCSECGHRISITTRRKKDNRCYTICNYYRTYIKEKICTPHSNNYDILEKEILQKLKESYLTYLDKEQIKKEVINRLNKEDKNNVIEEYKYLIKEINNIKDNLDTIYLDKINNKIDNEQYQRIREKLGKIIKIKEEKLSKINKEINQKDKKINLDAYLKEEYISRELIINLIEKIEISKDKIVDIKFTFSNKS